MPPLARSKRRILLACILAVLSSVLACSSEKNAMAPVLAPVPSGPPIEIRSDADTYGLLSPITLLSAPRLEGRTLRIKVGYGGGCTTHTIAAIGSMQFQGSLLPQLTVYIRHDDAGDRCEAYFFPTLSFDVTPAIELHRATYGVDGPFYLRIVTPDSKGLVLIP